MKADTYTEVGVPVVRGTNISDTRAWKGDWVYIPEDLADRMKRCLVFAGDLVLPHRGSIGEVAIIPDDEQGRYFISSSLMKITLERDKIDPLFCYYFLRSAEGRSEILRFSSSVGTPGIGQPLTSLRQFKVPVPPLPEQHAIAATLGALDDKIELNRKMNATLEAMARALFRDWFVDFGPTRAKMAGRAPYLSPDLWSLFPGRLDDEGKPEGWEVRSVYDFANVVYGAPFASKQFNTDSAGIPLIRIRDLATHEPGVWTEEAHPKGHLIEPGDIVVGMDGEFRLHVWKGAPAWLNQRVCHFEPRPGVPTAFLAEALIEPLAFFERGKVGTTVIHLGKGDIDTFRLLHPGMELLSAFGEIAGSLIDATVKNANESRTLAQTRDLLLPRLMSGELRVAEAETLASEVA